MRTMAGTMLVALLLAASARAEDACKADVERLCAGISPGGGRLAACLKANEAQLSPGCKAERASVSRMVKEVGAACEDDIQSICPDVKPGSGNVLRCLRQSFFSVTPRCQELVRAAQEKVAEFQKACGADARRLCKGIRPGEGRVLACLASKEAELSPECRELAR
jgi:hypothetical protein